VAGKAGRVGFSVRPQRRVDRFEHALQILIDVGIPEPQHAKSFSHEIAVAALIPRSVVVKIVLPAVDFNGELMPACIRNPRCSLPAAIDAGNEIHAHAMIADGPTA